MTYRIVPSTLDKRRDRVIEAARALRDVFMSDDFEAVNKEAVALLELDVALNAFDALVALETGEGGGSS